MLSSFSKMRGIDPFNRLPWAFLWWIQVDTSQMITTNYNQIHLFIINFLQAIKIRAWTQVFWDWTFKIVVCKIPTKWTIQLSMIHFLFDISHVELENTDTRTHETCMLQTWHTGQTNWWVSLVRKEYAHLADCHSTPCAHKCIRGILNV